MRAAPPLTENNAEISTYVRVMQQEREEEKSEEALTFSRLWRFLSSSVSFSSFDSAMAKKKKASTPLPQTLTSSNETLVNNTLQNSKNTGAVSNPSTIVEDEELVTPGPSIVHPSVGAIPRTDAGKPTEDASSDWTELFKGKMNAKGFLSNLLPLRWWKVNLWHSYNLQSLRKVMRSGLMQLFSMWWVISLL